MSHVAIMDLKFTNLEAIKKAAQSLGLEFRQGQETFNWFGTWVGDYSKDNAAYKNGVSPEQYGHCTHAIRIPGDYPSYSDGRGASYPYEIGVIEQPDGSYKVIWDFWSGELARYIGQDGKRWQEAYGFEASYLEASAMVNELNFEHPEQYWECVADKSPTTGERQVKALRYR